MNGTVPAHHQILSCCASDLFIIIIIISVMQLGHLLTRSGLTCPEVSSKVCHDSFCQSDSSVSLTWIVYYKAFCLHVVFSFSCIPVKGKAIPLKALTGPEGYRRLRFPNFDGSRRLKLQDFDTIGT
jgi:hypothetical protein